MKWSVGAKIGAGFGLALAILLLLGSISYRSIVDLSEASARQVHSQEILKSLEDLGGDMAIIESAQRGYVLTGRESDLEFYGATAPQASQKINQIRTLLEDNSGQLRRLERLEPLVSARLAFAKNIIEIRKTRGFEAAVQSTLEDKNSRGIDGIQAVIEELIEAEQNSLAIRARDSEASAKGAVRTIAFGLLISLLAMTSAGYIITRNITTPLKRASLAAERIAAGDLTVDVQSNGRRDEVGLLTNTLALMVDGLRRSTFQIQDATTVLAASATEILASVSQLTSGAAETATAVTETATTVEEVRQTAHISSQKAKFVSETAQRAVDVSHAGEASVTDTVKGMDRIREQMESIAESIVRLSEQSQAIAEIIASVNDLAEQSNLLSVNASIEAARAGDHGKGFAVVAQEVKTLAEQSKKATGQVRAILSDIQKATSAAVMAIEQGGKAVEAGVKQSTETGSSIQTLARSVAEAAQAALQIEASSHQQLTGVDQVTIAMENIKQASLQNVDSMRQVEVAAHNLNEIGQKLKGLVGQYKVQI